MPAAEADRQQLVRDLHLPAADAAEPYGGLVRLAALQCGRPIAWLALLQAQAPALVAALGLPTLRQVPPEALPAWPAHWPAALATPLAPGQPVRDVADCRDDLRWATLAHAADLRACAACPVTVGGYDIGVLVVAGPEARPLSDAQRTALQGFAELAASFMDARLRERRLRLQNARLRTASLSGSDWLWETDEDGRLSWVSDGIEAHTGEPPSAVLGRTLAQLHQPWSAGPPSASSWSDMLARQAQQAPFKDVITERPTPRGPLITSVSGVPVFDSQGQFRGYRGATSNVTAKLAAEGAARRAEQLLGDALESLGVGVMISDPQDRVLRTNALWRASLRMPPEGANWAELLRQMVMAGDYPDAVGREEEFLAWRRGIVSDEPEQHEIRWRDRWIMVSARRLPHGNVVHLSVDITRRKRIELKLTQQQAELRESQARLTAVLEAVPDLWFVLGADGHYIACGDNRHPMLVQNWEAVKGKPFSTGLPESLAQLALPAITRALESGEVQSIEYSLATNDGVLRSFEARISPMPGDRVLYVTRDVTQQHAAEQALQLAEERWNFALEGSGDGVWDWDARHNTMYFSPRWKQMIGFGGDEPIGNTLEDWTSRVHPDDQDRVMHELRRHLRGETAVYQSEHRLRHREGHDIWVLDRGKVVERDADGRPLRLVGTRTDITLDRQAEQTQRDKQAAELASRAKSEFLSRMSHEMRTPLNAVIGFAQLIHLDAERLEGDKLRSYAGHVLDAGQHLLALVNDVLDLQKVEEGGLALDLQAVALDAAVARMLELLQPMAQEREVRFEVALPAGECVRADPQRLRQVLLNVASNAIKYNRRGGLVRFSATPVGLSRLALQIDDTGAGIGPAQMSRLFQPFERLGYETSNVEGTGLGLIIARSLTQAIGGQLEVSSVAGHGTSVRIVLPRADEVAAHPLQAPHAALAAVARATPGADTHPALRMLYVEDNRINALLFEEALRPHAARIDLRVAEDGEEALQVAREWRPDVLVLDAHLPGMSGFDVLRELRLLPGLATTPAFMCSADAMPDDVQRAYEAGFIGYWTKPVDIKRVLAEVEALSPGGERPATGG